MSRRVSPAPDHPHAGGENFVPMRFDIIRVGPSPRGWGEQRGAIVDKIPARTIPTRVGRTHCSVRRSNWRADHPHAGGENCLREP